MPKRIRIQQKPSASACLNNNEVRSLKHRHIPANWQPPPTNLDRCLAFSWVRCVVSLVSMVLLATDIPRAGLGVKSLSQFYTTSSEPGAAIHFGPYAYPVMHIAFNSSTGVFTGRKGGTSVEAARIWSYKFDTTSIGLRGVAHLFNVSEFPRYLLYEVKHNDDQLGTLDLATTWTMLDSLITKVQSHRSQPFRFAAEHMWTDRLHHYLYQFISKIHHWRLNTVHVYHKRTIQQKEIFSICSQRNRPKFCDDEVPWLCKNPLNASLSSVSISDHVDLRLALLQQQYPELMLDLTIYTTFSPTSTTAVTQTAYYETYVFEIVMLIRGRMCTSSNRLSSCSTVFIDDFRYERGVIKSNIAEWFPITAGLRATAQFYVWIRLLLLLYGSYVACATRHHQSSWSHMKASIVTMLKIPFHVVVYGSVFPITCYVIAHLIDSTVVDSFLDTYWAAVGGASHFDLMAFIRTASVQMRNVWLLALLLKGWVFIQTKLLPWRPHDGVVGIRGFLISVTSFLSIFGSYKSLSFRSVPITVIIGPVDIEEGETMEQVRTQPASYYNPSQEGFSKDMKMTFLVICIVLGIGMVFKVFLYRLQPKWTQSGVLFVSSTIIPYSAGTLWPITALGVCFRIAVNKTVTGARCRTSIRISPAPLRMQKSMATPLASDCRYPSQLIGVTKNAVISFLHHAVDLYIPRKQQRGMYDQRLNVGERTEEVNSLILLMNIAMMTDPWTMFRLRVLGVNVYFYNILPHGHNSRAPTNISATSDRICCLPCPPEQVMEWVDISRNEFRLITKVTSRDLPLSVLLQCG